MEIDLLDAIDQIAYVYRSSETNSQLYFGTNKNVDILNFFSVKFQAHVLSWTSNLITEIKHESFTQTNQLSQTSTG